ncbi:OmpA family protein [Myxococcus landrumensis]|uniref:OmpA family protein n=1 Tax=Myxococcus landrumensis TaxID=2813577 RepID=A0ABX7NA52_9BACT|nr:OmpA family protein [Myxococcus landrumus]QSQ14515.1 OmpA family protein [Myxococcus landrumus]
MSTSEATSYTFRVVNADGSVFGKGCFTHEGPPARGAVTIPAASGPKLTELWYSDPLVGTLRLADVRAFAFSPEQFALQLASGDQSVELKGGSATTAKPGPIASHRHGGNDFTSQGRSLEFPQPSEALPEGTQGTATVSAVDLVVVIDASKSMRPEAVGLSETLNAAMEVARTRCPCDLRVTYLGIEGVFQGTRFDTTVRDYLLETAGANAAELKSRPYTWVAGGKVREDGGRAIEDLSNHFDWRPEAQRAVFFLGDEGLDGGGDVNARDVVGANKAIQTAQQARVRVHTYLGVTKAAPWELEALKHEYARVAEETGGQSFLVQQTLEGFQDMLTSVICASKSAPNAAAPARSCCQAAVESPAATVAASTSYTFRVLGADGGLFGKGCFTHEGPPTQSAVTIPPASGPKLTAFWYHDAIVGSLQLKDVRALSFAPEQFTLELANPDNTLDLKAAGASPAKPGAVSLHRSTEGDFASQHRVVEFPRWAEPTVTVTEGQMTVPAVDLVVAIDASKSMREEAVGLSEMVGSAIKAAQTRCPSNLRVTYLGIEGTFGGTRFTTTVRDYLLQTVGADEAELKSRRFTWIAGGKVREDGARTIQDLSAHFDWRTGAQRAIFFLGDEGLNGGGEIAAKDIAAANHAIEAAVSAEVRVHTYLGASKVKGLEALESEYARVARETGGQAYTVQRSLSGLQSMLESVICGSKPPPVTTTTEFRCCQACVEDFIAPRPAPPPAPEPAKVVVEDGKLRTLEKVYFASDKDNAIPESLPILDHVFELLRTHTDIKKLRIEAHTDNAGTKTYNQDLSARRAKWVRQYLIQKGIAEERLDSAGFGLTKPIDSNATPQGRANNRRVEFVIVEEQPPPPVTRPM